MRNSPVILAIAATIGAIHGCSLPLEGLPLGGDGGATSVTSAGGALSTTTGTMTSASGGMAPSTSTGVMECTTSSQCPSAGPCVTITCSMGQCVPTNLGDGTPVPDESGNCRKIVCMGGVQMTQPDPDDFTEDGNPCTHEACGANGLLHDPVQNGSACGDPGQHCLDGQCRDCASDGDCSDDGNVCTSAVCNQGTCGQKSVGGICNNGGVSLCDNGSCCLQSKVCYDKCCSASEHCTFIGCQSN